MKKLVKLLLVTMMAFSAAACSNNAAPQTTPTPQSTSTPEVKETITLNFTIIDETNDNKVLFEGPIEVSSECETLADVINAASQLEAVTENGQYGMTILGLMGVEGDWDKGPWWLYESENNEGCAAAGYCDGASNLKIADGDIFTFVLTSEF